ncbi:hypothetical protein predicted by Glimmer/Critica [Sorangium cellulosum So ce56]|uniref:Uncharacterized protein n=1 Tax=Sorangium cellulosum (strain So ce56) TaxID=448385 RepID=A9FJD6_SORC5|nr:hypothetical protein predicted by Glimmer/Critica [Sorangium cellulosum So ce56]
MFTGHLSLRAPARLLARPAGLSLLQKGQEPFPRVVRREAAGEPLAQERQRRLEVEIVLRRERLEAEAHRDRALRGDGGGHLVDRGVERVRLDHLVEESALRGLVGVEALPEEHHLQQLAPAHVPLEHRHDHHREQADVDLRRPELGAAGADREVRRRDEPEPAAQRVAVHPRHNRLARVREGEQEVRVIALHLGRRRPLGARDLREVPARAERVARAGQDHAAHRLVRRARREGVEELAHHRRPDGVLAPRVVQREPEDAPRREGLDDRVRALRHEAAPPAALATPPS